ncbi:MAG: hypothetical protein QM500_15230 [Methylococcales bacterium]
MSESKPSGIDLREEDVYNLELDTTNRKLSYWINDDKSTEKLLTTCLPDLPTYSFIIETYNHYSPEIHIIN